MFYDLTNYGEERSGKFVKGLDPSNCECIKTSQWSGAIKLSKIVAVGEHGGRGAEFSTNDMLLDCCLSYTLGTLDLFLCYIL